MEGSLQKEILDFAVAFSGGKQRSTWQSDLPGAFAMDGADVTEFLEAFADQFEVDLSPLRWEFHYNADEPPGRRRVLPLDPAGKVIPYDPITLEMLERAVLAGRWTYEYPEHNIKELPFRFELPPWPLGLSLALACCIYFLWAG
ncbi:hypothetical protein RSK20926_04262 [Roseobacter sp. SK209-2-6]|uniref:DUF1493 family protein n=1 Tax=Roseobacter sp. SK209-2-6 TaxID=388739 RepID=UPI0000F3D252|nr:DUF1493 family protein [Roseobacter sp. SK209-2-6]EBA15066.1 hypothetical protein RSK20926_04262 [Roseobacter sp. SK209-2-6]